jgi:RNA polymerase sigma factor (sigma-70 family)
MSAPLDETAFAALYDRHAPAVAAWLRRRSDPDAAQELLAETFAEAWCSRRRFQPERGSARAWLFGIAQHLLFGYYRRLAVEDRARRKLGVVLESPAYDEADERLDAAALRADLAVALAALAPGTREAVLLRVVEQLDYDELGRRLGCSSPAARLRVSRGLRELRRSHPGPPALAAEGAVS